jgi:two-component system copper resistance phosphate regulon response regulator CusR
LRILVLEDSLAVARLVESGPIKIDPEDHRTWVNGEEVELTAKEFDPVSLLLSKKGRVLTTAQLLQRVWKFQHDPGTNRVAVYINRVRTKIGTGLTHTVRSIDYVFAPNR